MKSRFARAVQYLDKKYGISYVHSGHDSIFLDIEKPIPSLSILRKQRLECLGLYINTEYDLADEDEDGNLLNVTSVTYYT